jgi:hypothetical protein
MSLLDQALTAIGSNGNGLRLLHVGMGQGSEIPGYLARGIEPIGIDGDAKNIAICKQRYTNVKFYNNVISDKCELLSWHLTHPVACSSVHEIDMEVAKARFPSIQLVESSIVSCVPIDVLSLPQIDGMVVDAQGHDYEVLVGAKETLTTCAFVICEVWLKMLYKGTTLFDVIVSFMDSLGFNMYYFQPGDTPDFWGDAIFVRQTRIKKKVESKKPELKPVIKPKILFKGRSKSIPTTKQLKYHVKHTSAHIKRIIRQRKKLLAERR